MFCLQSSIIVNFSVIHSNFYDKDNPEKLSYWSVCFSRISFCTSCPVSFGL